MRPWDLDAPTAPPRIPRLFQPILAWDVAAVQQGVVSDPTSISEADGDGLNAIGLAAVMGLTQILRVLLAASTDAGNDCGALFRCTRLPGKPLVTPLMAGCWLGHIGVVDALLTDPRVDASQLVPGPGPHCLLDVALARGDLLALRRLCRDPDAASAAWPHAFVAGTRVSPSVIKFFVAELGADPDVLVNAELGETALMRACTNYDAVAVDALLAFSADVARRDVHGRDACARLLRYLSGHGRELTVGVPPVADQQVLVERLVVAGATVCESDVAPDVARMAASAVLALERRLTKGKRRRS